MARGRGSAMIIATMLAMCFLFHNEIANAKTFQVGDEKGWTFGVSNWPKGKTFKAGDILEFKYDRTRHNVAMVSESEHSSCTVPSGSQIVQTGDDKITLKKGKSFYICTFFGHCGLGVKIAINAQ